MKFLKRLGLFMFSLVAMLLLIEGAIRLLMPVNTIGRWAIPDKRYGFFHRKNFAQEVRYATTNVVWTVRINSLGLRGGEFDLADRTSKRILMLGDSFTFGYGINEADTFSVRLGDRLRAAGLKTMVFNAGVTGWGTAQEVLFARDHMEIFRPDIVVITFCQNDQVDDVAFRRGVTGGLLPTFPGKRFIRDHSHLYALIYRALYEQMFKKALTSAPKQSETKDAPIDRAYPLTTIAAPNHFWATTESEIKELHVLLKRFNPSSVLLIQAAEYWNEDVRSHLRKLDNGKDVLFVDLHMRVGDVPRKDMHLGYDPHWNERMNDISSAALCDAAMSSLKSSNSR